MNQLIKKIINLFKPKLNLCKGTRLTSLLFIAASIIIAAGALFAANLYYNMDTGEVVMEEIQRVTQVIRATAGLIIGGANDQNPATGYQLEVVGNALFDADTVINNSQVLKFLEDGTGSNYVAFKAPSGITTDITYILPNQDTDNPQPDYVLTYQSGGQLAWKQVTSVGGAGDITQVGDVTSGGAFDGSQGNTLYFEGTTADDYEIALTAEDPSQDYTITLPAQTGTVGLLAGSLTSGGIMFASDTYTMSQDAANLFWDNANTRLGIGTNLPAYTLDVLGPIRSGGNGQSGAIRIYSEQGTTDYEVVFQPSSSMTGNTIYTLPPDTGSANYVLTTDGSGTLTWKSVTGSGGAGAVGGSGTTNKLAKWTDSYTLGDSSISDDGSTVSVGVDLTISGNLTVNGTGTHTIAGTLDPNYVAGYTLTGSITGSGSPDITGINQFSGVTAVLSTSVTSPLYTGTGAVTISSGGSGDIILDPASGVVQLGTGDVIKTSGGYSIAASGQQILREVIPIMGYDLPVQCSTACDTEYATISRTIEDYPFSSAASGTTRKHKLVIRYATSDTSTSIKFRVYDETTSSYVDQGGGNFDITVSASPSTDLAKGVAAITDVVLPSTSTDDWHLEVQGATGLTVKIYQIFLAAYDEID